MREKLSLRESYTLKKAKRWGTGEEAGMAFQRAQEEVLEWRERISRLHRALTGVKVVVLGGDKIAAW